MIKLLLLLLSGAKLGKLLTTGGTMLISVVVAVLVSSALVFGVRPVAKRQLAAGDGGLFGVDKLVGRDAIVLAQVDVHSGRVRLGGQEWSAKPFDPLDVYAVGDTVRVLHIEGATAVVWGGV